MGGKTAAPSGLRLTKTRSWPSSRRDGYQEGPLDQLLEGRDPQAVFSKGGLFDELKKALAERVLNTELDDHLEGEAAEGR